MKVSQNNFNYAQKLSITDMTRSVSYFLCLEIIVITLFVGNWCEKLVIISFGGIFKFFNWSHMVELPSSDEMKMIYTEHKFQVDLGNLEFNLKFHAERTQH